MRKLEDTMNWLTDMDWGWWPIVSLRPPKDRDIDNKVLLRISLVAGTGMGLLVFLTMAAGRTLPVTPQYFIAFIVLGIAVFFVLYKVTFAYCWNRRAARLRNAEKEEQAVS